MNRGYALATLALAVSAVGGGSLGCADAFQSPVASSVSPRDVQPAPPGSIPGPFVQAGATFAVRMDKTVDTYETPPGAPITATVATPLTDARGQILVSAGAKVHGMLASVGPSDTPTLRIDFQSIDTNRGAVPFSAAIRDSQHYTWLGPDPLEVGASIRRSTNRPPLAMLTPYTAVGSYANLYGFDMSQPREVRIPSGSLVELELVAPLVVPTR